MLLIEIHVASCRGNFGQQHGDMDVERRTFDALQRIQRHKRYRAKVSMVRHQHGERKYEFVPGNKIAQVRFSYTLSEKNFSVITLMKTNSLYIFTKNPFRGFFFRELSNDRRGFEESTRTVQEKE